MPWNGVSPFHSLLFMPCGCWFVYDFAGICPLCTEFTPVKRVTRRHCYWHLWLNPSALSNSCALPLIGIGRKPVIIGGLLVFALGSIIAALSHSIEMIIVGRTLQGMGAVAAATMALAADLTREENRSRVMAFIGMTIGLSFMAAIILGPIIYTKAGMSGIFWFTFGLALCGICWCYLWCRLRCIFARIDSGNYQ